MDIVIFELGQKPYRSLEPDMLPAQGFAWVDIDRQEHPDWAQHCQKHHLCACELHERHIADSLNILHPPYYDGLEAYDMLIFRSIIPARPDNLATETRPVVCFLMAHCLITVHSPENGVTQQLRDRLLSHNRSLPNKPAELLSMLLDDMTNDFLSLRDPLSAHLDHWRNTLLKTDDNFASWSSLLKHRNSLYHLATLCEQHLETLDNWREDSSRELDAHSLVRFNDVAEHIERVRRHVQHMQSEIDFLIQLNFSASSQRTNRIMWVLTAMSALFLPLNLVAGIFGMNFVHIPMQNNPLGFYWIAGSMLLLSGVLLVFLKLKKWI